MRRVKEKNKVYEQLILSPKFSTRRTSPKNSFSSDSKLTGPRTNRSPVNFLRFGCPTDVIVHIPEQIAVLNTKSQVDLSKSNLNIQDLIDQNATKKMKRKINSNFNIWEQFDSIQVPIKSFEQVKRPRHYFYLSKEEPKDEDTFRLELTNKISEKPNFDYLKISPQTENIRKDLFDAISHIKSSVQSPGESWKNFTNFSPYAVPQSEDFIKAVKAGRVMDVQKLFTSNKKLVHIVDSVGETPLHWAVKRNDKAMAQLLIVNGAKINEVDISRRSPVFLAAKLDFPEMVKILLDAGADVNIPSMNGLTLFDIAKEGSLTFSLLQRYTARKN
ncbi:unnamed protein product [Blepharisma stoltei]|uniref:Ankyrin repeat domain-containing protein n=1 Tax=Blepharisma stoltei TaxID=1481888 RepID=A0AAU9IXF6_9CILI|nr:unnamed protein product [Blepharisma stoltei]